MGRGGEGPKGFFYFLFQKIILFRLSLNALKYVFTPILLMSSLIFIFFYFQFHKNQPTGISLFSS